MAYEFLAFAMEDDVARLTLRRPPLNVMHPEMVAEMQDALGRVAAARAGRVLVIAAEGKMFSAGVSIEDHLTDRARPMITAFHIAVASELNPSTHGEITSHTPSTTLTHSSHAITLNRAISAAAAIRGLTKSLMATLLL